MAQLTCAVAEKNQLEFFIYAGSFRIVLRKSKFISGFDRKGHELNKVQTGCVALSDKRRANVVRAARVRGWSVRGGLEQRRVVGSE